MIPYDNMKEIVLRRLGVTSNATIGVLQFDDQTFCTLELLWQDNQTNQSCIPSGEYVCEMVESPKYGRVWEITNVPNRSHILIHYGNYAKNSLGCILIGTKFGILDNELCVLNSKMALGKFLAKTEKEQRILLKVIDITN